jgi:type 2 lantibiotic biosynthesis protein LanM
MMTEAACQLDVEHMIAVASALNERLSAVAVEGTASDSEAIRRWMEESAFGDEDRFNSRLAWDGLSRESAMALLTGLPVYTPQTEPFWAPAVRSLIKFLDEYRVSTVQEDHWAADVPFAHAIDPFVEFSLSRLGASGRQIGDALLTSLKRDLLLRLFEVCSLTLGEEFLRWRKRAGVLETLILTPPREVRCQYYISFVGNLKAGGWLGLFVEYPVLARLIATVIEFWAADTSVFLAAYEKDQPEFAGRFFGGKDPGELVDLLGSVSDFHRNGRAVKILTFDSGRKLVYKPKNLAIDAAWGSLVRWLGRRDQTLDLFAPSVWVQREYGWVEFVEHRPCPDLDAVRRFYYRAGVLGCLLYIVKASDFHHENLIARGEHLVPVDLETLFSHTPREQNSPGAGDQRIFDSVLSLGLLPSWEFVCGTAFDMSGLGTFAGGQTGARAAEWKYPNTDHMHLALVTGGLPVERNMPRVADSAVDPGDFAANVEQGFRAAYTVLLQNKDELLAAGGPLSQFADMNVRVVLRPTQIYARFLKRSVVPRLLRNGIDRSLEFEGLSRRVLHTRETLGCRNFFFAELRAVEQLDVPFFEARTSSSEVLTDADGVSRGILQAPSHESVRDRVAQLSDADCEFQLELIGGAFAARAMRPPDAATVVIPPATPRPEGPAKLPPDFIAEAQLIAEELYARALHDEQGRANWIGLEPIPGAERYNIRPLGNSLHAGVAGAALFFAGLHVLTSEARARKLALAATRTMRSRLFPAGVGERVARNLALGDGIGGGVGIGGTLYWLSSLSLLLSDATLLEDGLRLARYITEDLIARDDSLDVMSGAAGTLLGLLSLWHATNDEETLRRAVLCANHLVRRQEPVGEYAAWSNGHPRPLSGFSHGAAGIAYALMRLHEVDPGAGYAKAAMKGFAYERSTYSAAHKNWPDFREWEEGSPPTFRSGWCHGAPGIGLARLGSLAVVEDPLLRQDALAALESVNSCDAYPIDSVCCGEFGMTEVLLAAERLGEGTWQQVARERASKVVRAAAQRRSEKGGHGYLLGGCTTDGRFSIGFFQGLAGIGYSLLRLAAPDRLPCVVLWD